jgi:hypothetical protein
MTERDIPNTREIGQFFHCKLCLAEAKASGEGTSARDYARLEVGYTDLGLQVWCIRHDCNVIHIDFAGKSPFYANTSGG